MALPPSPWGFWGWEGKEHEEHVGVLMQQAWQQHGLLLCLFHWQDLVQMATSKCRGGWEIQSMYRGASFCYSDQEVRKCAAGVEWDVTQDHEQFGVAEVQGRGEVGLRLEK